MIKFERYAMIFFLCSIFSKICVAAQPNNTEINIKACRAVVDAVNQGKLDALVIPVADLGGVDVNNDGKPERVDIGQESIGIIDGDGHNIEISYSSENNWDSDNLRWVTNFLLIKYGKHVYILGETDSQPNYLARVDDNNIEKVVCEFGKHPTETLVKSNNDKLCKAVLLNSLEYVKFDRLYALSTEDIRVSGFDYYKQFGKFAANVDINNDGENEYVIGLGFTSGGGNICDGGRIWVLNKARNKQDISITQKLPDWVCGSTEQAPFIFDGHTYIKARGTGDYSATHRVVQLKRNQLDEVCQFDVKASYYVLGE